MDSEFTVQAQVYILEKAKKTWNPASENIMTIRFIRSSKDFYKVVAPPFLDTSIVQNTIFRKSGEAFVQWYDSSVKQMFGLNLKNKSDATPDQVQPPPLPVKNPGLTAKAHSNTKLAESNVNANNEIDRNQTTNQNLGDYDGAGGDDRIVNVLEKRIKNLEEKISLLEQTNKNLLETIAKNQEISSKEISLMGKDNELLKSALQQSNQSSEYNKRQAANYQESNSRLQNKISDITKAYERLGEAIGRQI